jgi:quercetin dioxygenase-like cupin family protein
LLSKKGEKISSHTSKGIALVLVLEVVGRITIAGKEQLLHKGHAIVMPAKSPHAVYASQTI